MVVIKVKGGGDGGRQGIGVRRRVRENCWRWWWLRGRKGRRDQREGRKPGRSEADSTRQDKTGQDETRQEREGREGRRELVDYCPEEGDCAVLYSTLLYSM